MAESINTNIANAVLRHLTFLERLENGSIRNIQSVLRNNLKEIESALKANSDFIEVGSDGVNALTESQERKIENLANEIRGILGRTSAEINNELAEKLTEFVNEEAEMVSRIVNRQIPPSLNVSLQFNRLPIRQVDAIVNTPLGGATFSERLAKSLGDSVFRVKAVLTNSIIQGETVAQAVTRVKGVVDDNYENNVEALVRTEFARVANQAQLASYRENEDVIKSLIFTSSLDIRVCPICRRNHGKEFPLDTNFVIPVHPRCLSGDTYVSARGRINAASKRVFEGEMFVIDTSLGNNIRVTPNHPIATDRGWVKAKFLNKGDRLLTVGDIKSLVKTEDYNRPTRIEEVSKTFPEFSESLGLEVPTTAEHFHGDGEFSEVSIINMNRFLSNKVKSLFLKKTVDLILKRRSARLFGFNSNSSVDFLLGGHDNAFGCIMCGSDLIKSFGLGHLRPFNQFGFGLSSEPDEIIGEPFINSSPTDTKSFRDAIDRFAGNIRVDNILAIKRENVVTHVYNLDCLDGFYVANNIITHNCRCAWMPKLKSWRDLGLSAEDIPDDLRERLDGRKPDIPLGFDEFLKSQDEAFQLEALGATRFELFKKGLSVKDMATDRRTLTIDELKQRL